MLSEKYNRWDTKCMVAVHDVSYGLAMGIFLITSYNTRICKPSWWRVVGFIWLISHFRKLSLSRVVIISSVVASTKMS